MFDSGFGAITAAAQGPSPGPGPALFTAYNL